MSGGWGVSGLCGWVPPCRAVRAWLTGWSSAAGSWKGSPISISAAACRYRKSDCPACRITMRTAQTRHRNPTCMGNARPLATGGRHCAHPAPRSNQPRLKSRPTPATGSRGDARSHALSAGQHPASSGARRRPTRRARAKASSGSRPHGGSYGSRAGAGTNTAGAGQAAELVEPIRARPRAARAQEPGTEHCRRRAAGHTRHELLEMACCCLPACHAQATRPFADQRAPRPLCAHLQVDIQSLVFCSQRSWMMTLWCGGWR